MSGPLAGIRVLELGTLIAAPFAARLLAEFGAEVVKVEPPGDGDPLRKWRKLHEGTSLWWYLQSRNKKSIAVDLKSADGLAVVKALAAQGRRGDREFPARRPGEARASAGTSSQRLNPQLTMVRISGYGQTGPYRDRPGFGAIGEAMGGMRYTTGCPDSPPARVGVSIGDTLASLHGVIGALMSLLHVKTKAAAARWSTSRSSRACSTSWKASSPNTTSSARSAPAPAARCRASRPRTPTRPATAATS